MLLQNIILNSDRLLMLIRMKSLIIVSEAYRFYVQGFRLFIAVSLALSLFSTAQPVDGINFSTTGYHLTIFELEFYMLLLIIYGIRPSRFRPVILNPNDSDKIPPQKKEFFFWMVYSITMLILFGISLLLLHPFIGIILKLIDGSNTYIISHTGTLISATLFLLLGFFRLWANLLTTVDASRFSLSKSLYTLISAIVIASPLMLVSIFRGRPDVPLILCFTFNAALLWTDLRLYLKSREVNRTSQA